MGEVGVKFKISGDETRNAFSIVEHPVEPKTLVPPHFHHDTDEYSYVLEGQFGARIGDEIILAVKGDYVLRPRAFLIPSGIPQTNPPDSWKLFPQQDSKNVLQKLVNCSGGPRPTR